MRVDVMGSDAVWLPTDVEETELERFTTDDNYCFQKKEDGIHVLASYTESGRVDFRNRRGEPRKVSASMQRVMRRLPVRTMLDAEELHFDAGLRVFDCLHLDGRDLRQDPYATRLTQILGVCAGLTEYNRFGAPLLGVVDTAVGTEDKRALVTRLRAENAEGVIIKDLRAPYTPGRRDGTWSMRRLKFLKSMTAIVERRNDGDVKLSFEMYLFDTQTGQWRNVGTVSSQQFHKRIAPGQRAIAEVTYLYATPDQAVIQPRLKRPDPFRTDKRVEDCTLSQLIIGGRFASA